LHENLVQVLGGLKKVRVAVATKGKKGLEDEISEVFGRTNTITIVDIIDDEIRNIQVLQNPALSYRYGAGPILAKTLVDLNVEVAVAGEFGPSISTLLEDHKIAKVTMKKGTSVSEAIKFVQAKFVKELRC
jgi:predicted Fe-Mo cluster-binding NifX family protein